MEKLTVQEGVDVCFDFPPKHFEICFRLQQHRITQNRSKKPEIADRPMRILGS